MRTPLKSRSVCFVAKDITPLLFEKELNVFHGGSEIKIYNTAEELLNYSFEISFIGNTTLEMNSPVTVNGFKFFPWKNPDTGLKYFKTALFYFTLWNLLKAADASLYVSQNANIMIFIIAVFCKWRKRKFIHWISHDFDTLRKNRKGMRNSDFLLYKIGSKLADITITQTSIQQKTLQDQRGIESTIIRNGHKLIEDWKKKQNNCQYILWIGRLKRSKQPHLVFKLGEQFPEFKFVVIGEMAREDKQYCEEIESLINSSSNVQYLGYIKNASISTYYANACMLISTSLGEGYPNTFLEAWNHSIPVVSLNCDPDGSIEKYDLGFYSRSMEQMVKDIEILIGNDGIRYQKGINGRKYLENFHDIKKTADQFYQLINKKILL